MFKKKKRYFTFGCSFTKYSQGSTWADIYAYQNDLKHYNHGEGGADNLFIASRVHEAIHFYDIDKDDEIGICWSFLGRISNIKPGGLWNLSGGKGINMHGLWYENKNGFQPENDMPDEHIEYSLHRDFALMQGVKNTLTLKGIPHRFFYCMNYFKNINNSTKGQMLRLLYKDLNDGTKSYFDIQDKYHGRYEHPTIKEHIQMLQKNDITIDKPEIFEHANKYSDLLDERTPKMTKNHVDSYFVEDIDGWVSTDNGKQVVDCLGHPNE